MYYYYYFTPVLLIMALTVRRKSKDLGCEHQSKFLHRGSYVWVEGEITL